MGIRDILVRRQKVEQIQISILDLDEGNMFLGSEGHIKPEMEV